MNRIRTSSSGSNGGAEGYLQPKFQTSSYSSSGDHHSPYDIYILDTRGCPPVYAREFWSVWFSYCNIDIKTMWQKHVRSGLQLHFSFREELSISNFYGQTHWEQPLFLDPNWILSQLEFTHFKGIELTLMVLFLTSSMVTNVQKWDVPGKWHLQMKI